MWLTNASQAHEIHNVKPSSLNSWCQAKLKRFSMSSQAHLILHVKPISSRFWCQTKLNSSWYQAKDSRYQAKLWKFLMPSQAQTVLDAKPSSNWILDIKPSSGSFWCQAKLEQFLMPSQAQMDSWCQAKVMEFSTEARILGKRRQPGLGVLNYFLSATLSRIGIFIGCHFHKSQQFSTQEFADSNSGFRLMKFVSHSQYLQTGQKRVKININKTWTEKSRNCLLLFIDRKTSEKKYWHWI